MADNHNPIPKEVNMVRRRNKGKNKKWIVGLIP
jgi:hypothetical protein